jgi:hypothetical protein
MLGFGKGKRAERHMAEWLAHPNEFGRPPTSVRHRRTYRASLMTHGQVEIDLVDYRMPDGTTGRGFVNGPLTWSFLGEGVQAISDDDLILAYCGWAWLFPALQAGSVLTSFESEGEEARFTTQKTSSGIADFRITGRFKIGTSELFEYAGIGNGRRIKGAGNTEDDLSFAEGDANYGLPTIYFLLGRVAVQSLQ